MTATTKVARRRGRKQAEEPANGHAATTTTATEPTASEQHQAALAVANGAHTGQLPGVWPTQNGRFFFWAMSRDDRGHEVAYRIKAIDGGGEMVKQDGTRYHVEDAEVGLRCDCPGCTSHGPECAGGLGCKHMRLIRALHQMFA